MWLSGLCRFLRRQCPKSVPRVDSLRSPLIDRQGNLREDGGRQVLLLAGQLRDQPSSPGLCPTIIRSRRSPAPSQQRQDVGQTGHIECWSSRISPA